MRRGWSLLGALVLALLSLTLAPAAVAADDDVALSAGEEHSCAVRSDGAVVCWGANDFGKASPPGGRFTSVSAGADHTCGVRVDGSVACWGQDGFDRASPPEGPFESVSAGASHSCGVRSDQSIDCWGQHLGEAPPDDGRFRSVSAGTGFSCGVRTDGEAVCWGSPSSAKAASPAGAFALVSAGAEHACGVRSSGTVTCWGDDADGRASPPGGAFVSVAAGSGHTCGLRSDGSVSCWGASGAERASAPDGDFIAVSAGLAHTCGARADGGVECWGSDRSSPPQVAVEVPERAPRKAPEEPVAEDEEPSTPPEVSRTRLGGDTRAGTAAQVASWGYPEGAESVVLARSDDYADALVGTPLAAALDAPLLLIDPDGLDRATADALDDLGPAEVHVIGGVDAVSEEVTREIGDGDVKTLVRVGGADRFATAAAVAERLHRVTREPRAAYVVADPTAGEPLPHPEIVGVAGIASLEQAPILLSRGEEVPAATLQGLQALAQEHVTTVGAGSTEAGRVLLSEGFTVEAVAGPDGHATAVRMLDRSLSAGASSARAWGVSGSMWPDGVVAAPAAAREGAALVGIEQGSEGGPGLGAEWLAEQAGEREALTIVGGPAALSDSLLP